MDKFREKEDYAATVCALHNLVLSLWDNDVSSQWSTGSITRDEETYRIISIDSKQEEIIGFIKAGYSSAKSKVKKLKIENALFIDSDDFDKNFELAIKNVKGLELINIKGINVYDILRKEKLVLTKSSVEMLSERLQ